MSPPPVDFVPGEKTGGHRVQAGDAVLRDKNGRRQISVGDFAAAIIDELESPHFSGQRSTVAY